MTLKGDLRDASDSFRPHLADAVEALEDYEDYFLADDLERSGNTLIRLVEETLNEQ